ncbi:hypothetical protein BG005_003263, partial [Podila minutissima]
QQEQWDCTIEYGPLKGKETAERARKEYKKALDEHSNIMKAALQDGAPFPESFKMKVTVFRDVLDIQRSVGITGEYHAEYRSDIRD